MKKKALQVVNIPFVLPYYFGDQIDFLKKNNIEITIACSPGPELDSFSKKYGVHKVPMQVLRRIDLKEDLKSLIRLIKLIRKENFEYVIGHTPKGALLSMLAAKLTGVKNRVYFRHGIVYETSSGMKKTLMKFLERLTSSCATKIVSVSKSVQQYSIDAKINSPDKSILLNKGTCNGVDVQRFSKNDFILEIPDIAVDKEDFVVGYVGRLVNDKGINELVEAWKIISTKIEKAKLLLVGPFEERDSLPQETKQFILNEPSIVFTDFVEDSVPYYNLMDVFILPSYREGFPTVVLEASSMSLPVITTKSTGCIDSILENETGVFTEIKGGAIADKILYYFEDPEVRKNHGLAGRKWVSLNFDQHIVWKHIINEVFN